MNSKLKGYIFAIIAATTYGMNPLFALPLYEDGMNVTSVLFLRYLTALPMLYIMLKMRGRNLKLQKKEVFPLFALGMLFVISSLTLFSSYNFMDAGIASTLLFVYPIMVALIMRIFFKEKMNLQMILCMIAALMGIALLFKGGDGGGLSVIGVTLVMLSSLSYSIYIVAVNKSIIKDVATIKVTIYVLFFGLCVLLAILLVNGVIFTPTKWYLWFNILALALFPTIISLLCTTAAIQYIGSTQTAILGALEPVTALFFGITVFDEIITGRDLIGIILIIVAVTFVVAGSSVDTLLTHFKKMFPKLRRKK